MTNLIPTHPEDYDLSQVRAELARIETVLPSIEAFQGREFRELPKKIQDDVHTIQFISQPTLGGLEKARGVLVKLWGAKRLCEELLSGQSIDQTLSLLYGQPMSSESTVSKEVGNSTEIDTATLQVKATDKPAEDAPKATEPGPSSTSTFNIGARPQSTLVIPAGNPKSTQLP